MNPSRERSHRPLRLAVLASAGLVAIGSAGLAHAAQEAGEVGLEYEITEQEPCTNVQGFNVGLPSSLDFRSGDLSQGGVGTADAVSIESYTETTVPDGAGGCTPSGNRTDIPVAFLGSWEDPADGLASVQATVTSAPAPSPSAFTSLPESSTPSQALDTVANPSAGNYNLWVVIQSKPTPIAAGQYTATLNILAVQQP